MYIKQKYLSRDHWKRVIRREYDEKAFSLGELHGTVGILNILEVSEPFIADVCGQETVLADSGITWLEILPDGKNWCLTAMYRGDEMLQFYFDVTLKNVTGDHAYFYDLFLDVTVDPDGNTRLLDRDELDIALSEGVITAEQHSLALSVAKDIQQAFPSVVRKLDAVCQSFLSE